ncbi:TraR/DksA family transcriptional regulator [Brenneria populi]|uniref:TraR/DksA family transcriptional regulator n=1 Tax=Brenneria populi TaxID=1505588 RepID=A0ABU6JRN8_9GAMM|nr:TraR/DksA family transcriptional regulator [Brenneria populi Li et al. 2015]
MADYMDAAQEQQDMIRDAHIANARRKSAAPSAFTCENCDAPIPEARRVAVPGVSLCVHCQGISELKSKHYRGEK